MRPTALSLDLEVFQGPFDLLLTLVLKEEVDLLEVDLVEIVLAYLDVLERTGRLELEPATEFLVLIAALCELKSRLMLAADDPEPEQDAGEAAEELLARMLEYRRHAGAAAWLVERLAGEAAFRYRSAPPPAALRRPVERPVEAVYPPERLAGAIGSLLRLPPTLDLSHVARPHVTVEGRLAHLRGLLARRGPFAFEEAVAGADRVTEAVTLFALLELHKEGEAEWSQVEPFGPIEVRPVRVTTA